RQGLYLLLRAAERAPLVRPCLPGGAGGPDAPQRRGLLEGVRRPRRARPVLPRELDLPLPVDGPDLLGPGPEALRRAAHRAGARPAGPPVHPDRLPPPLVPAPLPRRPRRPPVPPPARPVVFVPARFEVLPQGRQGSRLRPARPLLPAELGPRPPLPLPL